MDPTYPFIPILNIVTGALVAHTLLFISVRGTPNAGVVMLGLWILVRVLIRGIEAVVWSDNSENLAPVWCDISTHIILADTFAAIPACSLVISRRLYQITRFETSDEMLRRHWQSLSFDIALGGVFPLVIMSLFPIVQSARFVIAEDMGCTSSMVGAVLSLLLYQSWGIVFPLISMLFYLPTILRELYAHHKQMHSILDRIPEVNGARYTRLVAISLFDMVITFPIGIIILSEALLQANGDITFWPPWPPTGYKSPAIRMSDKEWRDVLWLRFATYFAQTSTAVLGLSFFLLFGAMTDALGMYRRLIDGAMRWKMKTQPVVLFNSNLRSINDLGSSPSDLEAGSTSSQSGSSSPRQCDHGA